MLESNIDVLMEEYKNGIIIGEGYANRSYNIINFTFLLYGAVIALSVKIQAEYILHMIYFYLLPVATYVLGLFYMYNSFVIMRQGYYMIRIEMYIKIYYYEKNKEESLFQGWNIISKLFGGGYILAYSTALMFYVALPIFDFICGFAFREWRLLGRISQYQIINMILNILPCVMFIVYIVFVSILIYTTIKMYQTMKNIKIKFKVNNTMINARPKLR